MRLPVWGSRNMWLFVVVLFCFYNYVPPPPPRPPKKEEKRKRKKRKKKKVVHKFESPLPLLLPDFYFFPPTDVCASVCLSVSLFVCIPPFPSLYISLYVCLSVCLSLSCLSVVVLTLFFFSVFYIFLSNSISVKNRGWKH